MNNTKIWSKDKLAILDTKYIKRNTTDDIKIFKKIYYIYSMRIMVALVYIKPILDFQLGKKYY